MPPILDGSETDPAPAPAGAPSRELETRWGLWWLLLAAAAACLVYLVAGPSPWTKGLDTSAAAKESVRTHSWMVIGFWYAAAINLGLAIAALLAWHGRPEMIEGTALSREEPVREDRFGRWSRWLLVALATLLSAWAMLPRLDLSLWGDEEATARRFIVGHVYPREEGGYLVKRPSWEKAAWNWDNGTNSHLLFNVLARLSHGPADPSGGDPERFYFSERRIRLPSFVATLLLVPAAALLVAGIGFPRGAAFSAFLLALHPWIVRYGSDARGYALLMLFSVLALVTLNRALRQPRRTGWWLAFGCCQWLALLSNLTAIYLLLPLNAAALWLAWDPLAPGRKNPLRVAAVWRFAGAGLLGAMLTVAVLLPILLQAPGYFAKGRLAGEGVTAALMQDLLAYWALGTPWHPWEPGNPLALVWRDLQETHPLATVWAAVLVGCFVAAGAAVLLARPRARWWLLPLLGPLALFLIDTERTSHVAYPWYTIGYLPSLLILGGVGFGAIVPTAQRWPRLLRAGLPLLCGLAVLSLFAVATHPQRQIIRAHPVEPLASSVRHARRVVNPFHPDIDETLTLGFIHATRLYDPAMTLAQTDAEFVSALRRADQLRRPLWVNAAHLGLGEISHPLASRLVQDREVFEAPVIFHGLQDPCTRYVFRYRPGGLARFEQRETGKAGAIPPGG